MTDDEFKELHAKGLPELKNLALFKSGTPLEEYDTHRLKSGNFISARECAYDGTLCALRVAGLIK